MGPRLHLCEAEGLRAARIGATALFLHWKFRCTRYILGKTREGRKAAKGKNKGNFNGFGQTEPAGRIP